MDLLWGPVQFLFVQKRGQEAVVIYGYVRFGDRKL